MSAFTIPKQVLEQTSSFGSGGHDIHTEEDRLGAPEPVFTFFFFFMITGLILLYALCDRRVF